MTSDDTLRVVAGAAMRVAAADARLVVDVASPPPAWVMWWAAGADVVGVHSGFAGHTPPGVTGLEGDRRDPATVRRVSDQVRGRPVDVLIGDGDNPSDTAGYLPLLRAGGVLLTRHEDHSGVSYKIGGR